MRPDREILNTPLTVHHRNGRLKVLKHKPRRDFEYGPGFTQDGIANSIDAEVIAKGTSSPGYERGAIVRHGRYVLWGFEGGVDEMTAAGQALFVNTVFYAARQANSPALEEKHCKTRDGLFTYVELAKRRGPGYLETLKSYLPPELEVKTTDEAEKWLVENRPYLRAKIGERLFEVDTFAKAVGIPNHKRALLERCIANLREQKDVENSVAALVRYTGLTDLGSSADPWQKWYDENKDYLFFSDTDGFRFKIDNEAKSKRIPSEKLRGWSSEDINYRLNPPPAK